MALEQSSEEREAHSDEPSELKGEGRRVLSYVCKPRAVTSSRREPLAFHSIQSGTSVDSGADHNQEKPKTRLVDCLNGSRLITAPARLVYVSCSQGGMHIRNLPESCH